MAEVDRFITRGIRLLDSDPVQADGEVQAPKYCGYCREPAIVSMLTGLFWEVEHSAIYKPDPRLNGIAEDRGMRERTTDVVNALRAFEEQFEALARQD